MLATTSNTVWTKLDVVTSVNFSSMKIHRSVKENFTAAAVKSPGERREEKDTKPSRRTSYEAS